MKIEILGTGCTKCEALEAAVLEAISEFGGFHDVKKIEDIVQIMEYGVVSTPALVIDGVVESTGKVLRTQEVIELMNRKDKQG